MYTPELDRGMEGEETKAEVKVPEKQRSKKICVVVNATKERDRSFIMLCMEASSISEDKLIEQYKRVVTDYVPPDKQSKHTLAMVKGDMFDKRAVYVEGEIAYFRDLLEREIESHGTVSSAPMIVDVGGNDLLPLPDRVDLMDFEVKVLTF